MSDTISELEGILDDIEAAKGAWRDRFERREMQIPLPFISIDIPVQYRTHLGWVCPSCDRVEETALDLRMRHGFDPLRSDFQPASVSFGETCWFEFRRRLEADAKTALEERYGKRGGE